MKNRVEAAETTQELVEDDERLTAPVPGRYGWADDFLSVVPFEDILAHLLEYLGDYAETLVGPHHGSEIACAIIRALPKYDLSTEGREEINLRLKRGDWRGVLPVNISSFDTQELFSSMARLYGYARGGEGPGRTPEESRQEIERLIAQYRKLVSLTPSEVAAALGDYWSWITDSLIAAEARWALDRGEPVPPNGLASLADVKEKTLANLVASRKIATDSTGRIPAAVALDYLAKRKEFVPSHWQETGPAPEAPQPALTSEPVFVPIDGDGQPFLPGLARRSRSGELHYAIGEKADPEYISDYWEALERLKRMPTPRWRRPNAQGNWGLVSAQDGWKRFARADLERMLEAVGGRDH